MTKADIVANISSKLGLEKVETQKVVEEFMSEVKKSLSSGTNVYLRGFGSFIIKKRAKKTGRNITKNTAVTISERNIPVFKPSKFLKEDVMKNLPVKSK